MWEIEKTPNELTVRERFLQEKKWLIFMAVIFFIMAANSMLQFSTFPFALGCAIYAFFLIHRMAEQPTFTLKINKRDKTLTVRRQSIFVSEFKIYFFDDIAKIFINAPEEDTHFVQMKLKDGSIRDLSNWGHAQSAEVYETAEILSTYIFGMTLPIVIKRPRPDRSLNL